MYITKNKIEMVRLADIVKDFKGALYELSQYFQDVINK